MRGPAAARRGGRARRTWRVIEVGGLDPARQPVLSQQPRRPRAPRVDQRGVVAVGGPAVAEHDVRDVAGGAAERAPVAEQVPQRGRPRSAKTAAGWPGSASTAHLRPRAATSRAARLNFSRSALVPTVAEKNANSSTTTRCASRPMPLTTLRRPVSSSSSHRSSITCCSALEGGDGVTDPRARRTCQRRRATGRVRPAAPSIRVRRQSCRQRAVRGQQVDHRGLARPRLTADDHPRPVVEVHEHVGAQLVHADVHRIERRHREQASQQRAGGGQARS